MAYGLQIFDASGNLILDTSTFTVKDTTGYSNSSITSNTTISVSGLTSNIVALVYNNTGEEDTSEPIANVTVDVTNQQLVVSGGVSGMNLAVKLLEF